PLVPDHAPRQLDHPRRAKEPAAGRIAVVAALSHWHVQAQRDRVGERQLDLAVVPARPEDAEVWNHPVPRAGDGNGFLRREETVLVERLVNVQLVPLAEKPFEVLLRDMAVPRRYVDDKLGLLPCLAVRATVRVPGERVTNQSFNLGAIEGC